MKLDENKPNVQTYYVILKPSGKPVIETFHFSEDCSWSILFTEYFLTKIKRSELKRALIRDGWTAHKLLFHVAEES